MHVCMYVTNTCMTCMYADVHCTHVPHRWVTTTLFHCESRSKNNTLGINCSLQYTRFTTSCSHSRHVDCMWHADSLCLRPFDTRPASVVVCINVMSRISQSVNAPTKSVGNARETQRSRCCLIYPVHHVIVGVDRKVLAALTAQPLLHLAFELLLPS